MKGQIISGELGKISIRQKDGERIEIGELLVNDSDSGRVILQVFDVRYGSQLSSQSLELISGMELEQQGNLDFMDAELRNYTVAYAKPLITLGQTVSITKSLPPFFSKVRAIEKEDLAFLTEPSDPLRLGKLRSGSKAIDVDIALPGVAVLTHHVLIPATTGRGKSNLTKSMVWGMIGRGYAGILVLDPHDEYYGRNGKGFKDHPSGGVVYCTPNEPPSGARSLKINLSTLRPHHFEGVVDWSDAQQQAINAYYTEHGNAWIEALVLQKPLKVDFFEGTLAVVRRRMLHLLDLTFANNRLTAHGVFDLKAGGSTVPDIVSDLEDCKVVVVDTSSFSGAVEILIGSIICNEVMRRYRRYKMGGLLGDKPVISVVLEEAPRVLGKEVLERGSNIFAAIAREGRKFKVGLVAITQLPSLIPKAILANMNTKIILGLEMAAERQAVIESSPQDLSDDSRTIAALDIGEALVSSNFAKFAMPIKVPLFEDLVIETQNKSVAKKAKEYTKEDYQRDTMSFEGVKK